MTWPLIQFRACEGSQLDRRLAVEMVTRVFDRRQRQNSLFFPANFLNPPKSGSKFFVAAAFRRYPQNSLIIPCSIYAEFFNLWAEFSGSAAELESSPVFSPFILNARETLKRIRRESVTLGTFFQKYNTLTCANCC